jgi:hypothetical protein
MGHSGKEKKDRRGTRRTQTKRGQGSDQIVDQIQPLAADATTTGISR